MKEEFLERIKYREAEKYASSLEYTGQKAILNQTDIPDKISECIGTLNKYSANPDAILPLNASNEQLADWLLIFLNKMSNDNIFFKCNKLYWKYWIGTNILDVKQFIDYLIRSGVDEFITVNVRTLEIIYLSSEEQSYWLFSRNANVC